MPLPRTTDIGKIISFLKKEKPKMSKKQRLAIALNSIRNAKGYSKDAVSIAMKKIGK